jgi:hypothetical protein
LYNVRKSVRSARVPLAERNGGEGPLSVRNGLSKPGVNRTSQEERQRSSGGADLLLGLVRSDQALPQMQHRWSGKR